MTPNTPPSISSSSRPGRKLKRDTSAEEVTAQKPKKVNSEIRKLQNRIASRNYREKRKRKLQYLQQLLQDQPEEEHASQSPEASYEESYEGRPRSQSAEDRTPPKTLVDSAAFSSGANFGSFPSTNDTILATTASYGSHSVTTTQPYANMEWNTTLYHTPPHANISTWNDPSWMPSIEYAPQMHAGPGDFQYAPPHTQEAFGSIPVPSPQPQVERNSNLFLVGSFRDCSGATGRLQGYSNVSPPFPLSYSQAPNYRLP